MKTVILIVLVITSNTYAYAGTSAAVRYVGLQRMRKHQKLQAQIGASKKHSAWFKIATLGLVK